MYRPDQQKPPSESSPQAAYPPQPGPSNYMDQSSRGHPAASQPNAPLRSYLSEDDEEEPFDLAKIDPALRLRTTRTAHSVIAESIRSEDARAHRKRSRLFPSLKRRGTGAPTFGFSRKSRRQSNALGEADEHGLPPIAHSEVGGSQSGDSQPRDDQSSPTPSSAKSKGKKKKQPLPRRTIYVNMPLPSDMIDQNGQPVVRYVRNKVRTSKYTLITFIPRNLFEQFHRVANVYFLGLVILQLFPLFGATTPQIAMLPLVAILGMTAIKDAIEDWRRARLDEEVNVSPSTKLGNWKNVNQPSDSRNWFERLLHLGPSEWDSGQPNARSYKALQGCSQAARGRSQGREADRHGAQVDGLE